VAEALHFNEMIVNEHVRRPHMVEDISDLVEIIGKVCKL